MSIFEEICVAKLVPVIATDSATQIIPLLNAVKQGGLRVAELTLRSDNAFEIIANAVENCVDMLIGAGTVLSEEQATKVIELGCKFVVSPGFSEGVARICKEKNILYVPGVSSATEIMTALSCGLRYLKFFPAQQLGGVSMIKALGSAFPQVKFMATGGVDKDNMQEYLQCEKVFAVGGSFMIDKQALKEGNYQKLTTLTREAVEKL